MTVNSTYNVLQYTGDGVASAFSFPFQYFEASDLVVTLEDPSTETIYSPTLNGAGSYDYAVAGTAETTGTGEYLYATITTNTAPPAGWILTLSRDVPPTQDLSLTDFAPFPAKSIEARLDKLTIIAQQLREAANRSLKVPPGDPSYLQLPLATVRANKTLIFDATGQPTTGSMTSESGVVSTAMQDVTGASSHSIALALMNGLLIFPTLAAMRANTTALPGVVYLAGYASAGDGGEGLFLYKSSDTTSADDGGSLIVDGAGHRLSRSRGAEWRPEWWGAKGDGATDDRAALASCNTAAAAAASGFIRLSKNYKITANLAFTVPVVVTWGGKLTLPTGVTLAFSQALSAPAAQIFALSGTAAVTFAAAFTSTGYAEWWGAIVNNAAMDCAPAINACIVACVVTQLQGGIYYTSTTVLQQTAGRTVNGVARGFFGTTAGTAIVNQTSNTAIYQIGPNSYSGALQTSNIIKDVVLMRLPAPTISAAASGLLVQFTNWTTAENVLVIDCIYGIQVRGTGQTHLTRCAISRVQAGAGAGTDTFYGIYINGDTNVGFAGGNASLYINNPIIGAASWSAGVDYQGIVALGAYGFSDTFIDKPETSNVGYGLHLVGNGNTSTTSDSKDEDVHITNPILDTCGIAGLRFDSISLYGAIEVMGGYVATATGATNPTGISYSNSKGRIATRQVEVYCANNATANGIVASNCSGIVHEDNLVYECGNVPTTLTTVTNSRFKDNIRNYSVAGGKPAMQVATNSTRLVLEPLISGKAGAFTQGVNFSDATSTYSEVRCSGIDPACISGNKLTYNGTAITSATTFGTGNLSQGIMA